MAPEQILAYMYIKSQSRSIRGQKYCTCPAGRVGGGGGGRGGRRTKLSYCLSDHGHQSACLETPFTIKDEISGLTSHNHESYMYLFDRPAVRKLIFLVLYQNTCL